MTIHTSQNPASLCITSCKKSTFVPPFVPGCDLLKTSKVLLASLSCSDRRATHWWWCWADVRSQLTHPQSLHSSLSPTPSRANATTIRLERSMLLKNGVKISGEGLDKLRTWKYTLRVPFYSIDSVRMRTIQNMRGITRRQKRARGHLNRWGMCR